MSHRPKIALLVETSSSYARQLIRGVSAYIQEHEPWLVELSESTRPSRAPRWIRSWTGDGIIARIENKQIANALIRKRLPVVNVTGAVLAPRFPRVDTDNRAVCDLAVDHFMERQYQHFGYVGIPRYDWSHWRRDDLLGRLKREHRSCAVFEMQIPPGDMGVIQMRNQSLIKWLKGLPKPVAVMACNDLCGRVVLEACEIGGLAVPDEVAVIGVDNDELICELCQPPLSSVVPNSERIGYLAAELLGRMLAGQRARDREILVKPTGVRTRRSTDATAIADRYLGEALRFIRAYACRDIGVEDIVHHVGGSRRSLEKQFKKTIGRPIHAEIVRVRIHTAQQLLTSTDLKLDQIAIRSGFKRLEYMSHAFKKKIGVSPSEYRARFFEQS